MIPRGIIFHTIYIHNYDKSTGKIGLDKRKAPGKGRLFAGWIYWFFTGLSGYFVQN
jgi:hypothetical protein